LSYIRRVAKPDSPENAAVVANPVPIRFIVRWISRSRRRVRVAEPSYERPPAHPGHDINRRTASTFQITGKCYVIDGDTIVIRKTRIRLAGIDAPELTQGWGQKSKWALFELCKGQVITAEVTGRDRYGRALAVCYLPDGRDVGAELIKMGLALDWPHFSGGRYRHLEPSGARSKLRHLHVGQERFGRR